jgi:DNA polymerase-3 subunit delta'
MRHFAQALREEGIGALYRALSADPAETPDSTLAEELTRTLRTRAVQRLRLVEPGDHRVRTQLQVAAEAQGHIGMALRLATSTDARARRKETLMAAMQIDSIPKAMFTAERWLELARKDADALTSEKDTEEKSALLATLGIPEGGAVPPALRADVKALEEAQKRRATRSLRDGIDRILVDLMSLYRDVLIVELGAEAELVNADLRSQIQELAATSTASEVITKLEALAQARVRISSNVRDLMVLESLAVALRRKK